jgi:large subunit ribosomal protein L18
MNKLKRAKKRKTRTRSKIMGTKKRPRLSVYRSNTYIYAQLIDDEKKQTLVAVSDKKLSGAGKKKEISKTEKALLVGELLAKTAKKKKISSVVYDRGNYKYHGRIRALAESARKGGLKF